MQFLAIRFFSYFYKLASNSLTREKRITGGKTNSSKVFFERPHPLFQIGSQVKNTII
jgi:hypothetical protein